MTSADDVPIQGDADRGDARKVYLKGRNAYEIGHYLERLRGKEWMASFRKRFEHDTGVQLDDPAIRKIRIPFEFTLKLISEGLDFDPEDMNLADICRLKALGAFIARREVGPLIQLFARAFSKKRVLGKLRERWRDEVGQGTLEVIGIDLVNRRIVVRLTDFPEPSPLFCAYLVGYFNEIGRLLLDQDCIVTHDACMSGGCGHCEFVCTW